MEATFDSHINFEFTIEFDITLVQETSDVFIFYISTAWSIVRKECPEPTCGFHCDKGIGCFTYNTTLNQQFVFTVHCWDAYDSDVTDDYILHLDYNRAPRFTNLPSRFSAESIMLIYVNKQW